MRLRTFFQSGCLALTLAGSWLLAQPAIAASTERTEAAVEKTEANIAGITAVLLEKEQFLHHPFDKEINNRFLDRYLDALDHNHMHFLQSDLDEFAPYRTNFNRLVMRGDNRACHIIFDRLTQRIKERLQYATNIIATEKFEFTAQERYTPDRHKLPAPKNMDEARQLWRQDARYQFLQEKLAAPDIKYSGPVDFSNGAQIRLMVTSNHPTPLTFLPKAFYDTAGKQIGSVETASPSNAIVRLTQSRNADLKKVETKVFSDKGLEIGKITVRWHTNDTSAVTNTATSDPDEPKTNYFAGTVQIYQKNLDEVTKTLTNRFAQYVKNFLDLERDDVFEIYLSSLAHAYDPHSDYMGHNQTENFEIMMKLRLTGIGAVLQRADGFCRIVELTEGGPAAKSGQIKPGDRIVAVAQGDKEPVDVVGMQLPRIVSQVRGAKGTEVRLTIIPAGAPDSAPRRVVSLIRDEIKLDDAAAKARIFEVPSTNGTPQRIGLIDLPSFYGPPNNSKKGGTTYDVARLIQRLKKEHVDGIILDLRRNGGGFLEEAITLTGLFITKGPVVQTKESNWLVTTDSDPDPSILYDGPMVVLISRVSASASEILAGALQDYGRAIIVGDRSTYGKGTVQSVIPLNGFLDHRQMEHVYDAGQLKMTVKQFYLPAGVSTQREGVKSDIELPSVLSYADIGESSLENNLPGDKVPAAEMDKVNMVEPYLKQLKDLSEHRVVSDRDFDYVRQDIEEYKKAQTDKSVSMNETERLAEKKRLESIQETRKKERQSRTKPDEKTYELTAKNVNLPDLQPPTIKTNTSAATRVIMGDWNDEDEPLDPKAPDPVLEEAKRILRDYIPLVTKSSAMTAKLDKSQPPAH
jgi:carboxyl-terminal processing protease